MTVAFNSIYYLSILPVAFSILVLFKNSEKTVFLALLGMICAESIRQYLKQQFVETKNSDKKLFLFGAVYEDKQGFFKSENRTTDLSIFNNFKILSFVFLALLSVICFIYAEIPAFYYAFLTLVAIIWAQANSMKQVRALLYFVGFQTCVQFSYGPAENGFLFVLWLVGLFYVLHLSFAWEGGTQVATKLRNSIAAAALVLVTYKVIDTLLPYYSHDPKQQRIEDEADEFVSGDLKDKNRQDSLKTSEQKNSNNENSLSQNLGGAGMRSLARYKLKTESLSEFAKKEFELDKMNLDKFDLPKLKEMQYKAGTRSRAYGKNNEILDRYKAMIQRGEKLSQEDLDKLKELANQINADEEQIENATRGGQDQDLKLAEATDENAAPQKSNVNGDPENSEDSKKIDELAKALGYGNNKQTSEEEDQVAYLDNRKKMASQVDKLIRQDRRNTLNNEQLKIQKLFQNFLIQIKNFGILIGLIIILTIWFTRKKYVEKKQRKQDIKNIELPSEVRKTLRHLYKQILKSNLSSQDEVLRSYYIVEIAFAQIEYTRDESLPPSHYFETLNKEVPYFAEFAEVPIRLFNRVFYGGKQVSGDDIKDLRRDLKLLLNRLQVI